MWVLIIHNTLPDQNTTENDFSMVDTLLTNPKTFKFPGIGLVILFLIGILIIIFKSNQSGYRDLIF